MSQPKFMLYCLRHDITFVLNASKKFKVISETGRCSDGLEWDVDRVFKIENGKLYICNLLDYLKSDPKPWRKSSYKLKYGVDIT